VPKGDRRANPERVSRVDLDRAVLIVTGSTLEAELFDRPVAYAVREMVARASGGDWGGGGGGGGVIVCSDIWYLNSEAARARPTISVGPPDSNALAAYLADRVDVVFAVDGEFSVQMDLERHDLVASLWGIDHHATTKAATVFEKKYLAEFLSAARVARS